MDRHENWNSDFDIISASACPVLHAWSVDILITWISKSIFFVHFVSNITLCDFNWNWHTVQTAVTVVGKGEILDFMASDQTLKDIWTLQGRNFGKSPKSFLLLVLVLPVFAIFTILIHYGNLLLYPLIFPTTVYLQWLLKFISLVESVEYESPLSIWLIFLFKHETLN